MKKTGIAAIALLAIVAIVFAVLYFTGNGDLTKIKETKDNLTAQVETLTADAAKAAEDAAAQLKAVTDEKDALAAQVETLTADAAKAADEAAAQLKTVTDEKDALAAQVETLTADAAKAKEDSESALKKAVDDAAVTLQTAAVLFEVLNALRILYFEENRPKLRREKKQ